MFDHIPPELRHATSGIAGSLVALLFMRRPPLQMLGIFLGGVLLAHYGGELLAFAFDMEKFSSAAGFIVGLLGMRLVEKLYDLIEAIDVKEFWQRFLKRVGLGG